MKVFKRNEGRVIEWMLQFFVQSFTITLCACTHVQMPHPEFSPSPCGSWGWALMVRLDHMHL